MMDASRTLSATLLRYVNIFMVQGSQTALANGRGRLDVRLARWLLMWDDRLRPDTLTVTHEFLALLLGVRRQGITGALHPTRALRHILDSLLDELGALPAVPSSSRISRLP